MKRYMIITKSNLLTVVLAVAVFIAFLFLAAKLDHVVVPASGWAHYAKLPVYGVEVSDKRIALTFNAAWTADDIPELLNILKKQDVLCTFFLVGEWAEKNPNEAKMIAEAGHEIGNHSYAHPDMTKLSAEQIKQDIAKADEVIQQATGVWPTLFRAPSGAYNDTVVKTAQEMKHTAIQWSIDSIDWRKSEPQKLVSRVLQKAKPGGIILMHTGLDNTRAALPEIINSLKEQGYVFVKVSDLLILGKASIDYNGIQHPVKNNANPN